MQMALRGMLMSLLIPFGLAAGESDIDFARRLLAFERTDFQTDDVVEHLSKRIRLDTTRANEAAVIDALVRVNQSRSASTERRVELLAEAEERCRSALSSTKNSEAQRAAQQEYGGILKEWLRAVRALAKKDPAQAKAIGADAARAQESIVSERKVEADALYAAFDALYKEYIKLGPEGVKPDFLRRMGSAFDAWTVAENCHVQAAGDWIECFEEGSAQRKEESAILLKRFEKFEEQGAIEEFAVVAAWYRVSRGRFLALGGDETKAAEVWREIQDERGTSLPVQQRKGLGALRRSVAYDLAKLLDKRGDWLGFIAQVERIIKDPDLAELFREDRGFELRLDYARALTKQERAETSDFEQALRDLKQMVEQEKKRGNRPGAVYQISRATADVLNEAQRQGKKLRVGAEQSYLAGYGLYVSGEQKTLRRNELPANDPRRTELQKQAEEDYRGAVRLYQQSISALCDGKSEATTRLRLEVKARHELSLCFYRMNQRYEAIIAAWALLDAFPPDYVDNELTKIPESKRRAATAPLREAWDAAVPMIEKAYKIQDVARAEIRKANTNPQHLWSKEFTVGVLRRSPWDEKFAIEDPSFAAGNAFFEQARRFFADVRGAKNEVEQKEPARKAVEMLTQAEQSFAKVASGTKYALPANFQRALVRVQVFDVQLLMKMKSDEIAVASQKAIEAIEIYERAAQSETSPLWTVEKKTSAAGALLLARASLEFGGGRFEEALRAADGYLLWIQKNSIQNGAVSQAQFLKFRAILALLESNADEALLAEAEKTYDACAQNLDETRKLLWMTDALMRVQQRWLTGAVESKGIYAELARWQARRLALLAQEMSEPAQLGEHTRWLSFLERSGNATGAIDAAQDLLKRFDAENKNAQIADEAWPALLARMAGGNGQAGVIDYADLNQRDRCRQEHRILIDLLYDTAQAALPENDTKRPLEDRLNANLERAAAQVEKIRKNFPTAQTLDPKRGEGGVALLQGVSNEIDFRRRILAARDLLLRRTMEQAETLQSSAPQKAERYRTIAAEQLKILMEVQGETTALKLQLAQLYVQTRRFAEALEALMNLRGILGDDRPEYFDVMKLTAQVYAQQERWEDAAEYPRFVAQTAGTESRLVRERWSDMGAFLEKCYGNGAKRPANRR